jgi:hypothetical protein
MMEVRKHLGVLVVLVSCAAAQSTGQPAAELQSVDVVREANGVRVEVTVSGPVSPSVESAVQPDRLVLVLPNTVSVGKQQRIAVNASGVRSVRAALNRANPPVTHVVVDLDRPQPYTLTSEGKRVILRVAAAPSSSRRHGAPAAAASGSLLGVFRRRREAPPAEVNNTPFPLTPPPPPPSAPIAYPGNQGETASTGGTTSPSAPPTAAHPNRGSLQEGTVFPSLGSPETGNVPPVSGTRAGGFPSVSMATSTQSASGAGSQTAAPAPAAVHSTPTKPASAVEPAISAPSASAAKLSVPASAPPTATALSQDKSGPVVSAQPMTPTPALQNQPTPNVSPQTSVGQAGVTSSPSASTITPVQPLVSAGSPKAEEVKPTENTQTSSAAPAQGPSAQPTAAVAQNQAAPATPAKASDAADEANQPTLMARTAPDLKTVFRVKYVAQGVAYLDGGRSSGLVEGMKLEVKDDNSPAPQGAVGDLNDPRVVAELEVTAVAETSAVTDIHQPKRDVQPGDLAYLSSADEQALVQQRALSATRKYPAVVTFTEGDPLDEEAREEVPRPPLPSVNRARGRIGLDYLGTVSQGAGAMSSHDIGVVLRADITRINGTYWNMSGYWRGRITSRSSASQPTLQDLINRTYHLSMTYDNPNSAWVAGFGRLYLPWASSLDTIDGGYFGRKLGPHATAGIFGGSTPDPTSWDYNPDRRIAGAFINFEGGSYDELHYTSTSGLGISTLKWQIDRPFVFFENGLFYKRYFSVYDSLQADSPRGNSDVPAPGPGLSRNFLTVRFQPHPRVELNFNHNYFRDIPTFDPQLVGTGLLDKYLFQGFSVGARVEAVKQVFVYTNLGLSNRTGDTKNSLNQLYGITFARLPWIRLRADAHYSRFNSSFGDGSYRSVSLSRDFGEGLRVEALFGEQRFTSVLAGVDNSKFVTGNVDWSVGTNYFVQGGVTVNRGGQFDYNQWSMTLGYRFDNRSKHKQ